MIGEFFWKNGAENEKCSKTQVDNVIFFGKYIELFD